MPVIPTRRGRSGSSTVHVVHGTVRTAGGRGHPEAARDRRTVGRGADERVWVAVQRTRADDQPGHVKLARFTPATGAGDFVAYLLDDARIKKVTRVALAGVTPVPAGVTRPVLVKQTVLDLVPALSAGGGGVAGKPEGLAITGLAALVGAVDNDGLDAAPGESVLLRLGRVPRR